MSNETDTSNPYSTPNSNVDNQIQTRSSIPKVIGIISLVMAGIGLLGAISGLAMSFFMPQMLEAQMNMGFSKSYLIGSQALSLITSLWAIFIGIKLLKYLDIGRRHFNYYTVVAIIMSIVGYFFTRNATENMFADMSPEMAEAATSMSSVTSLAVFIGPVIIIGIALLLNQQRVKDCLN